MCCYRQTPQIQIVKDTNKKNQWFDVFFLGNGGEQMLEEHLEVNDAVDFSRCCCLMMTAAREHFPKNKDE